MLIGSVKTNLGHTEATACLTSIAKVILIFEYGLIPANLHLKNLNEKLKHYSNKLKPITKNTEFLNSYVAVNSFGIGGANSHIILKPHDNKIGNVKNEECFIPRIVPLFGRNLDCLVKQENFFRNNPNRIDYDFISLFSNISITEKMNYRCFILKDSDGIRPDSCIYSEIQSDKKICFIFPGKNK